MTRRRSPREIERAIDDLAPGDENGDRLEVSIVRQDTDGNVFLERRVWEDENGEWHSETVVDGRDEER